MVRPLKKNTFFYVRLPLFPLLDFKFIRESFQAGRLEGKKKKRGEKGEQWKAFQIGLGKDRWNKYSPVISCNNYYVLLFYKVLTIFRLVIVTLNQLLKLKYVLSRQKLRLYFLCQKIVSNLTFCSS